jgi:hypothetical protein
MPPAGPDTRRRARGVAAERFGARCVAERADDVRGAERLGVDGDAARCGDRLAAGRDAGRDAGREATAEARLEVGRDAAVDTRLAVERGATADADFAADLEAAGREAAVGRAERSEDGRGGAGAAARDDGRGLPPERSDDGRPAGLRRESGVVEGVVGRALRAAGVTAVGVIWSSGLQLAGGAQVR